MELERADFHVHIGELPNKQILTEAKNSNVKVLGLLDRGVVRTERLQSLRDEGRAKSITVIPGLEYFVQIPYQGSFIQSEIVGLDFDPTHPKIKELFHPRGRCVQDKTRMTIAHVVGFLNKENLDVPQTDQNIKQWGQIQSGEHADIAYRLCKIAVSSPENNGILTSHKKEVEQHLKKRPQDSTDSLAKFLFWKFFAPGMPGSGYRKWYLDHSTVIDALHMAGGLAIIAHPNFQHDTRGGKITQALKNLFDQGIDGVEGWDAGYLDRQLSRVALESGKVVVGGSGTDLSNYSNRIIGKGDSVQQSMFISPRRLDDLLQYKARQSAILAPRQTRELVHAF